MDELRIPKVSAEIVCHTIERESIHGLIFLDMISAAGFSLAQILDFFNSTELFFPFKIGEGKSILLHKKMIYRVDVPGLFHEYETEVASLLDLKREARVEFRDGTSSLEGRFIIDMPMDHARSLDLLNAGRRFVPFLMEETLALLHTEHIYKVDGS
jgi:hypothetical protein